MSHHCKQGVLPKMFCSKFDLTLNAKVWEEFPLYEGRIWERLPEILAESPGRGGAQNSQGSRTFGAVTSPAERWGMYCYILYFPVTVFIMLLSYFTIPLCLFLNVLLHKIWFSYTFKISSTNIEFCFSWIRWFFIFSQPTFHTKLLYGVLEI